MSSSPIALHESPGSIQIHCIPGVSEAVIVERISRLISSRFREALDHHAVKTRVTENARNHWWQLIKVVPIKIDKTIIIWIFWAEKLMSSIPLLNLYSIPLWVSYCFFNWLKICIFVTFLWCYFYELTFLLSFFRNFSIPYVYVSKKVLNKNYYLSWLKPIWLMFFTIYHRTIFKWSNYL